MFIVTFDHKHFNVSSSDLNKLQSEAVPFSSKSKLKKVPLKMVIICFAFCSIRRSLASILDIKNLTIKGYHFGYDVPSGQNDKKSGMNIPRLFRGTGKPSKPASVGAMSDCSILL